MTAKPELIAQLGLLIFIQSDRLPDWVTQWTENQKSLALLVMYCHMILQPLSISGVITQGPVVQQSNALDKTVWQVFLLQMYVKLCYTTLSNISMQNENDTYHLHFAHIFVQYSFLIWSDCYFFNLLFYYFYIINKTFPEYYKKRPAVK